MHLLEPQENKHENLRKSTTSSLGDVTPAPASTFHVILNIPLFALSHCFFLPSSSLGVVYPHPTIPPKTASAPFLLLLHTCWTNPSSASMLVAAVQPILSLRVRLIDPSLFCHLFTPTHSSSGTHNNPFHCLFVSRLSEAKEEVCAFVCVCDCAIACVCVLVTKTKMEETIKLPLPTMNTGASGFPALSSLN